MQFTKIICIFHKKALPLHSLLRNTHYAEVTYAATMAQLVEQRIRNAWVAGSSPASGSTTKKTSFAMSFFYLYTIKIQQVNTSNNTKIEVS